MNEREQVLISTLLGAVVGGVFGTLYFTERGRRVREQIEPMLDNVIEELQRSRQTLGKARVATGEGRRALDELLKNSSRETSSWVPPNIRETAP